MYGTDLFTRLSPGAVGVATVASRYSGDSHGGIRFSLSILLSPTPAFAAIAVDALDRCHGWCGFGVVPMLGFISMPLLQSLLCIVTDRPCRTIVPTGWGHRLSLSYYHSD